MTNRESNTNTFIQIIKESPSKAITALCLVIPFDEATNLLQKQNTILQSEILSLLQWMNNQNDDIITDAKPRIAELINIMQSPKAQCNLTTSR